MSEQEKIMSGQPFRIWKKAGNEYRIEIIPMLPQLGFLILFLVIAGLVGKGMLTSHGMPITGTTEVRYSAYESWHHGVRVDDVEVGDVGLSGWRRVEVDLWNSTDQTKKVSLTLSIGEHQVPFKASLKPGEKTWIANRYKGATAPQVKVDWK